MKTERERGEREEREWIDALYLRLFVHSTKHKQILIKEWRTWITDHETTIIL
jgi:hypothetical protein